MQDPVVLGFYGFSNTGKTTVLQKLIRRLNKEGVRIAAVKQSDKTIGIDKKGKDTWVYGSAGAHLVVFSAESETDFLLKKKMDLKDVLSMITAFGCFDLILVEGARDKDIPKIRLGSIKKRSYTIMEYTDNFEEIIMYIKKEMNKQKNSKEEVTLEVNGKKIPLTEFPAQMIQNTILGMVRSLKGVDTVFTLKLEYKKK